MDILKDLLYTNQTVIKKTWSSLLKNWPIIFTGAFYLLASLLLGSVVQLFGFLGGIVMIAATSALISNYLYLLDCILKRDRITLQDFKDGFTVYFRKVWSISFILYLVDMMFGLALLPILGRITGYATASLAYAVLLLIFLNPLPEIIYQKYYQSLESITYAFEYVKDNWLDWFVPNLILMGTLFLLTFQVLGQLSTFFVWPSGDLSSVSGILMYLVGQILFSFAMIYRGYLFEILSGSNRRKRLYMRKF